MRYIIVVKDQTAAKKQISSVTFYEFNIDVQSFFDWIGSVKYEEVAQTELRAFTPASGGRGVVMKMGPEKLPGKTGESENTPSGEGEWLWLRNAKSLRHTQTIEWRRLGRRQEREGIMGINVLNDKGRLAGIEKKTIEDLNIRGIPESGFIPIDTKLTGEFALFRGGGVGGARPRAVYTPRAAAVDELLGLKGRDTDKLWGSIENMSEWARLRDEWIEQLGPKDGSVKLFMAIRDGIPEEGIKPAPGALKGKAKEEGSGTQFHITPKHYKGLGVGGSKGIGTLRITDDAVIKFFKESAAAMNEELVTMFNKLADLNDNIGRFFLADCGGGAGPSKCTDKDAAKRTEAGQNAMNDSKELEAAVVKSVSGMTEG